MKNPEWKKVAPNNIARGTPIRAILDMEARTLSFAIGDEEPKLAFTSLPASVRPYVCSGEMGEKSILIVSGRVQDSKQSLEME